VHEDNPRAHGFYLRRGSRELGREVREIAPEALERLRGVPTVAVDGSQIPASKEFAVPVSLVQVAWFENPHAPDLPYVKDVLNEIVTAGDEAEDLEEYALAESRLNPRRFALEVDADYARALADPNSYVTHLLMRTPTGEKGSLDAMTRRFPGVFERGASFVTLEYELQDPSNPTNFWWKLYRLTGPVPARIEPGDATPR